MTVRSIFRILDTSAFRLYIILLNSQSSCWLMSCCPNIWNSNSAFTWIFDCSCWSIFGFKSLKSQNRFLFKYKFRCLCHSHKVNNENRIVWLLIHSCKPNYIFAHFSMKFSVAFLSFTRCLQLNLNLELIFVFPLSLVFV